MKTALGFALGLTLSLATHATHAQAVTRVPPANATAEPQRRASAADIPVHSVNCGLLGTQGTWASGTVYADTSTLFTRSAQQVAAGWCVYLASGGIPEPYSSFAQWSDAQLADALTVDPGIEWARATASMYDGGRIRFRIMPVDAGPPDEHFSITTTIERPDSGAWVTRAVHTATAVVRKDTVRFESIMVPKLATAMRWSAAPLRFTRLDGETIDTTRANAAAAFVVALRKRLALNTPTSEQVLYLYTPSSNGRELLGFSEFATAGDGFTIRKPTPFLFTDVSVASEFYRPELVRVALMARATPLNSALADALSKVLGGVSHRTWTTFLCEDRQRLFDVPAPTDIPSLFAMSDEDLHVRALGAWELAFLVDVLITNSGDAALRTLLDSPADFSNRQLARDAVSKTMGISTPVLLERATKRYAEAAIKQRCGAR